jgi:hypothetical protein
MAVGVLISPNRQSPAGLKETKCLLSSELPTGAWGSSPPSDVARTPLVSERLARPALPVQFQPLSSTQIRAVHWAAPGWKHLWSNLCPFRQRLSEFTLGPGIPITRGS